MKSYVFIDRINTVYQLEIYQIRHFAKPIRLRRSGSERRVCAISMQTQLWRPNVEIAELGEDNCSTSAIALSPSRWSSWRSVALVPSISASNSVGASSISAPRCLTVLKDGTRRIHCPHRERNPPCSPLG